MNGVYGTKRPANFDVENDAEIFYYYRPNRNSESDLFSNKKWKKITDRDVLQKCSIEVDDGTSTTEEILNGMYDLHLPSNIFGEKGIYTIYIRPKEITTTIVDVSNLYSNSNVRGIVLDSTKDGINDIVTNDGDLVGYRVEYYNTSDTSKKTEEFRIVISNNKCEPVAQNLNTSVSGNMSYRFNSSSNLIFCVLSPSTSMPYNKTNLPFIGSIGQKISLINTKFDPIMLEVEMVENDIEGIATMLKGDQLRNLENGTITTFNEDGEIYNQTEYGNIKSDDGLNHDYKLKKNTVNNDETKNLEAIKKLT